jgi:hypothetical protein
MRFLLIAFLLTGCGHNYCPDADFVADGLCVISNNSNITPMQIYAAVQVDQKALAQHGLDLDLADLLASQNTGLIMKDPDWSGFEEDKVKIAGYFDNFNNIFLSKLSDQADIYLLSHEILHAVAKYALNVSDDDNYYHRVPYMFKEWHRVYHPEYRSEEVECNAFGILEETYHWLHQNYCDQGMLNINSRDN